ncbi:MAG: hypothetical protein UFG06_07615 [Lachnospiraceae bacterium]|nr:hypothetical protein [Lachnospiraceae bacterium]
MDQNEMPLGLGFGLAMNEKAMENFARMDAAEKAGIVESAHNVHSKAQMEKIVQDIESGGLKKTNASDFL